MREVHLVSRLTEGVICWSGQTQHAALELVVNQAHDAVSAFLDAGYIEAKIAEVETEAGIPVRDIEATLEFVGKQLRFTTEQQSTILNHFLDGGDRSCGGMPHAVTSTAQTLDDADDAYEWNAGACGPGEASGAGVAVSKAKSHARSACPSSRCPRSRHSPKPADRVHQGRLPYPGSPHPADNTVAAPQPHQMP